MFSVHDYHLLTIKITHLSVFCSYDPAILVQKEIREQHFVVLLPLTQNNGIFVFCKLMCFLCLNFSISLLINLFFNCTVSGHPFWIKFIFPFKKVECREYSIQSQLEINLIPVVPHVLPIHCKRPKLAEFQLSENGAPAGRPSCIWPGPLQRPPS